MILTTIPAKTIMSNVLEFFSISIPSACLRASSLAKRFGWGIHADAEGRVAIYAVDSKRYQAFARDPAIAQVRAMRSKRA